MEHNEPTPDLAADELQGPARRTIIKGAAWSIPVIAAATIAPYAAATGNGCSLQSLQPVYPISPSTGTLPFQLQLGGAGAGRTVVLSIAPAPSSVPGGGPTEPGGAPADTPPQIVPGNLVTADANGMVSFQLVGQGLGDFVLTVNAGTCGTETTLIHVTDEITNNLEFWGFGGFGNIGDGSYQTRYIPTSPSFPSSMDFIDVGGSYITSFAVRDDGKLYAWGWNGFGQFGLSPSGLSNTPVEVPLPSGVGIARVIDTPYLTSLAIGADGRLYSWGYNGAGGAGNGSDLGTSVVGPVTGLTNVTDADGGNHGGIAIDDGIVKTWGYNVNGQLGNGTPGGHTVVPNEVVSFAAEGVTVVDVASSSWAHFAVSADGDLYSWGHGGVGVLGRGNLLDAYTPTIVPRVDGQRYTKVWANHHTVYAQLEDGSLVGWGQGAWGTMGNGSVNGIELSPVPAFTSVPGEIVDVAISYHGTTVLTATGEAYFAGYAAAGGAGNGSVGAAYYSTPVRVFDESGGAVTDVGATFWGTGRVLSS